MLNNNNSVLEPWDLNIHIFVKSFLTNARRDTMQNCSCKQVCRDVNLITFRRVLHETHVQLFLLPV